MLLEALKKLVSMVLVLSLVGCTSLQTREAQELDLQDELEVGETVKVFEKDGRVVALVVSNVDETTLYGTEVDGWQTYQIPFADIRAVELERVDGGKTVLGVLGGIVAIPVIVVGVAAFGLGAGAVCSGGGC